MTGLLGALLIAHLASYVAPKGLAETLAVTPTEIETRAASGDWPAAALPLIAHAFVHAGPFHLFFNSMLILQTGELVAERYGRSMAGALKFLLLFAVCAVGGALAYIAINPASDIGAVGASGAACGLFAAYLMSLGRTPAESLRHPAVRRMGFYFLLVNVGVAALARFSGVLPIAWEAHLGGFVAGALLHPLLVPKPTPRGPWG